jgi:hypothetical protein
MMLMKSRRSATSRGRGIAALLMALLMLISALPAQVALAAGSEAPDGDGGETQSDEDKSESRGILPGDESFESTNYRSRDTDNNSKKDALEARYTVSTTVLQEQVQVLARALDGDGNVVKFKYENFTAFRFGNQQRNWTFYAHYTGNYRISLTLFDSQGRQEDKDTSGVFHLDTGVVKRWIGIKTRSLDLDKDTYKDDVEVHVTNWTGKNVNGANVWINGSFLGKTNASGKILGKNYPKGWINIDAFYGSFHNSTAWKSEGDGTVSRGFSVRAETFDFDDDGLEDDVEITVRNSLNLPVNNAQITINGSDNGTTNAQGQVTVFNIRKGFWIVNATKLNNFGSTTFYSEGQGPGTDVDEYFFDWEYKVLDIDKDDRVNDLRIRVDVDVDPPITSNVTVWANLTWWSNNTAAYNVSANFTVKGTQTYWDNITIKDIRYGMYAIRLVLKDSNNNTEDFAFIIARVVRPSNHVNIETGVPYDPDTLDINDLLFRAVRVNEAEPNITISLFNETGSRVRQGKTGSGGRRTFNNLPDGDYNFTAKDKDGRLIEKGLVVIGPRVQVETDLNDLDFDGFYDDFEVRAYNNVGRSVSTVSVTVWAPNGTRVTSNRTVGGSLSAMNLTKGTYEFNATYLGNELVNGTFYSYGNVYETFKVVVKPTAKDLDGDGRYDDVNVSVVDNDDSPLEFAKVYVDGTYKTLTSLNGTTIVKDLSWGVHTIEARYSGELAKITFFSEGKPTDSATWTMLLPARNEKHLATMESEGTTNETVLLYYAETTIARPRASHLWIALKGHSQEISLDRVSSKLKPGSLYEIDDSGVLEALVKYMYSNYPATRTSLHFMVAYSDSDNPFTFEQNISRIMKGVGKRAGLLTYGSSFTLAEGAYEVRQAADYAIGTGFIAHLNLLDMVRLIVNTPATTTKALGERVVTRARWNADKDAILLDLTKVGTFITALDDLAKTLETAYPADGWNVQDARNASDCPYFKLDNYNITAYAGKLASELSTGLSTASLRGKASSLKSAIDSLEVKLASSTAGLAIMFPNDSAAWEFEDLREMINDTDLAKDTYWDEFLEAFWRFRDYGISVNATAFDKHSSGQDNDVKIFVNDTYGKAISGARVHIDRIYAGTTNSTGWLEAYNYTRGIHLVNVTWQGHEAETTFQSEGTIIPNEAPTVTITDPAENETVNQTYTIRGTSSDPDGIVSRVEVRFNGSAWSRASGRANWQYVWDTNQYDDGTWLIEARAYDGDLYSKIVKVNVTVYNPVVYADVLLVDDDGGQGYETWYTASLTAINTPFDVIEVASGQDGPDADRLKKAKYVIWFTGEQSEDTLTSADRTALASFLDGGGGLWLTGQDIGRDLTSDGSVSSAFLRDYLRANYIKDNANDFDLIAVENENISAGINISIEGGTGARNQNFPSEISPRSGAAVVYLYNGSAEAAVKYASSTFRTVYFAFGFEGISILADRNRVLENVLEWLAETEPTVPNKPPVASAGNDVVTTVGEVARFRGSANDPDGLISLFEWDFDGDGVYDWFNETTGEALWTYDEEGCFTAKLRVTDNVGEFATDSVSVVVNPKPPNEPPVAIAGDDIEVDQGDPVEFIMGGYDPDGTVTLYEWDYDGDGTYDESSPVATTTTHTYFIVGVYNATLRVTDDEGAHGMDVRVVTVKEIVVNEPPVAEAGPDVTVEIGKEALLQGSGTDPDGQIVMYEWDFDGDGTYDSFNTTTGTARHTYTSEGVYIARLKVIDDDDAAGTDTTIVNVTPVHVNEPPVADAGPDTVVPATVGEEMEFSGTGEDPDGFIMLYEWDFDGDGVWDWSSPSDGEATWTYDVPGLFIAKLRVTDNENATDIDILRVSVSSAGGPNKPPVVSAGGPYEGVAGDPVTLTGTASDPDGTIVSYEWDFDGDGTADHVNPSTGTATTVYDRPGTYSAVLTATDDDGAKIQDTTTVTIVRANEKPTVAVTTPTAGEVVKVYTVFRGTADDDLGVMEVQVRIDDGAWTTANGLTEWSFDFNPANYVTGQHTLKVRAKDTDDEFSREVVVQFVVEGKEEPSDDTEGLSFTVVAAALVIVALVVLAAAVLMSRKRRDEK